MSIRKVCNKCNTENEQRYFCKNCGAMLTTEGFSEKGIYEETELKVMRIIENLKYLPHSHIMWNDSVDLYLKKVEKLKSLMKLTDINNNEIIQKMMDFVDLCTKSEFQIAFVGTIKTGKSTLINSILGHNYASMAVTPETAALTKFRSSEKDFIKVTFYSKEEWKILWNSRTSAADAFMREYQDLKADEHKNKWVGRDILYKEILNSDIEEELSVWSSSKRAEHYFVKEIEVGISTLPFDFPKQVVLVDTPGLSDPVAYRSEITKQYIRKANAVFVCVDAQKIQKAEIETISSVFSFSSHNKKKVHIIATHWDKLNRPIEDWKEQKEFMKKGLVGKGFFDTREMANENIMHSAAHIYNLCRDFEKLDKADKLSLMQFAIGMEIDIMDMKNNLDKMKSLTNIDFIKDIITNELAKNYRKLLVEDIEKNYLDIKLGLRRLLSDDKKETKEILEISKSDIQKMRAKVEEKKKEYDEIKESRERLLTVLKAVEKSTGNRLEKVLSNIKKYTESGRR